jgi:hypothetical protein
MGKYYKGKYTVKNKAKYKGDYKNVVYRSSWERAMFRWCDENPSVVAFNSEEVIIPYICQTDNRQHRYFMDVYFKLTNGQEYLIEIKPRSQTLPPKTPKKRSKKYVTEALTYIKNQSKWTAAQEYANRRNMVFEVWDEHKLRSLGMKIL